MPAETRDYRLAGRHLVLGIPCYTGTVPVEFMEAVVATIDACHRHGVQVTMATRARSALPDKVRDELIHSFLTRTDGTDLLMIDSDVVWQPEDVLRLLAWGTDHEFVVGPYCTKEEVPAFYYDLKPTAQGKVHQNAQGLLEVKTAPGGFNLLRRSALEMLCASYPELRYRATRGEFAGEIVTALCMMYLRQNDDNSQSRIGEDIALCHRWANIGGRIWMDPAITLLHIGTKQYTKNYVEWLQERQASVEIYSAPEESAA